MAQNGIMKFDSWSAWHGEYDDPASDLNGRKRAVQAHVAAVTDQCAPGPVTMVSICGGQGREVIGALERHPRRGDVRGRIVELDADNAAFAREWAERAGLNGLEVLAGDASAAASYLGLPPADLVVISGVFGHLSMADRESLIDFASQLCRTGGRVVWTFFDKSGEADVLRSAFRDRAFEEEAFEVLDGELAFTVARSRFTGMSRPLDADAAIFTFGSSRSGRKASERG